MPTPGHVVTAELPSVPADIQACFRRALVDVPDRDLSMAEVEGLWKQDRYRAVVMRNCGQRFLAWYEIVRRNWK